VNAQIAFWKILLYPLISESEFNSKSLQKILGLNY